MLIGRGTRGVDDEVEDEGDDDDDLGDDVEEAEPAH
jgi:hypothetical protein